MTLDSVKEAKSRTPFFLTQVSSFFSVVSGSMVFLAFPWLAIELTGSATSAGLLITLTSIPGLLLAPVMGSIIDKFGRRRTILWIEIACVIVGALIPFVAGIWTMTLPILILLGIARSAVGSGSTGARKSLTPDISRVAHYTLERGNSIGEAVFASGFAIGPALAALCIASIGPYNTFYVVALCSALAGIFMLPVRVREYKEDHEDEKNFFKFAVEGFRVLFKTPSVLILMLGVMTLAMIYLPTETIVLTKYYNDLAQPQNLGIIISTMAAFSVIGALLFERLSKIFKYSTIFRIALLGVAGSMAPMSFLPSYGWMLFFGALLGLAWGPLMPLLNTVIQRKIAPSKRGRVFSLEMVIWSGGPMISMVFVGASVDVWGVPMVYKVLAVLVLAAGSFVVFSRYMKEINTADYSS